MRYSQRLQKYLKACRFQHPFGQETERACLRAAVEGSPALPTHLIPKGCSNRARLGGSRKVTQQSVLSHPSNISDARGKQGGHPTPAPPWQQGKQILNTQNAKVPWKPVLLCPLVIQGRYRSAKRKSKSMPAFLRSFLGAGGRGPKAPHKHLQDRTGLN